MGILLLKCKKMEKTRKKNTLLKRNFDFRRFGIGKPLFLGVLSAAIFSNSMPVMAEQNVSDLMSVESVSQEKTVQGTILDENGEPLIGVTVLIKGTTSGTVTDFDGKFSLNVAEGAQLEISYVGYQTQVITVGNQSVLSIKMKSDAELLDEVVVVGYGVVKKRDLTGSVASVKSDEITKVASSNAMQAMQAKVPGLDIQQSSGQAGAGLNITLRGNRSINASNSPLILVDGVEYGSTIDISTNDIESMEVLKDASSTAIYGTRGANGVIIITTKKGKSGKTKVNFNTYVSINQPTNVPKVMYGLDEVQRLIDAKDYKLDAASGNWGSNHSTPEQVLGSTPNFGLPYSELEIYQEGSYTNWLDLLLQNGITQNYDLSVSGGTDKTVFNISSNVMIEEGMLNDDKLNRYNVKGSVSHDINKYLKVGLDLLYTHKEHDKRGSHVFNRSLNMSSIAHPYDDEGNIILKPSPYYEAHANPLLDDVPGAYQNDVVSDRLFGTGYFQITPFKGLVLKTLFNVDYNTSDSGQYADYQSVQKLQEATGSYISWSGDYGLGYTWDNTINYLTDFGGSDHSLSVLLGSSTKYNRSLNRSIYGSTAAEHYYSSAYYDLSKILNPTYESSYVKTTMQSYFGRLNYNLMSKYLFTFTLRADGSSVLADGNKWGYFPSAAAAWRISDEAFMESTRSWLDNLKLRLSWGRTGNSAIDAYQTLPVVDAENPLYYHFGSGDVTGRIPTSLGNNSLTWEKTTSYNVGLDFGFLNNRIYGSFDFYVNSTSDLLYAQSLPPSSVYSLVLSNVGKTKGHGYELQLGASVFRNKDFSWDTNLSYTSSKDEIVELSNGLTKNISGRTGQIVGEPINIYYYYESDGCWGVGEYDEYKRDWEERHPGETLQFEGKTGDIKIIDRDDNGIIDENDKRVYDRNPKFILGWNNSLTYKDFSLSFLLYARVGGWMEYEYNNMFTYNGSNWAALDYWTPDNQGAKIPSPGLDTESQYKAATLYESASYVKIKDITLGYQFPKNVISKIGLSNVKLSASLKNFFTFSGIDNYDPERGGDISFPLAKQVVFGLNVEF